MGTLEWVKENPEVAAAEIDAHCVRRVCVNKLRDEMAAAYRHAEAAHTNLSRSRLLEFISKINSLC